MKKFFCVFICLLLLMGVSCSEKHNAAIYQVDSAVRAELVDFLHLTTYGWDLGITVEGSVGFYEVGEVRGTLPGGAGMEIVAYSVGVVGSEPVEIGRATVAEDGSWGPLTVLYGPKLLTVWDGDNCVGEWLSRRYLVTLPLFARGELDWQVDTLDSAITALAFIHAGEWQAAADVLGALQPIHSQYGGLPAQADVFGRSQDQETDFAVTAWAGYATALLAAATDRDDLWQEASVYHSYLIDYLPRPQDNKALVPMRLMQDTLALKDSSSPDRSNVWKPSYDAAYDCWQGLAAVMLDDIDPSSLVDFDYIPESEAEKWVQYYVLAELGRDPENLSEDLDALVRMKKGKAVSCNEHVSVQASAWMLYALSGTD